MRTVRLLLVMALFVFGTGLPASAEETHGLTAEKDVLVSLGEARDSNGRKVHGYKIIHYKKNHVKSPLKHSRPSNNANCYSLMASGAKWKTVEPWVVNASNTSGLSEAGVLSVMQNGVAKWEDAADGVLGSGAGKNILGDGSATTAALVADEGSPDGQNEVYFGAVDQGAIAITIVWGVFSGPTLKRQLVEWDQVYGSNYNWSLSGEGGKMDLDNIATHEIGHSVGLADLYQTGCNQQTMFGYADAGETAKRTLEIGDINGVKTLYK